ncbi:MAG: beta-N-acetylhexosaminidase [Gammaproteobacteria bacterium]|nr:beta-N-acetylhexosaminidase [Gammaproteobacteria bacterium]
MNHSSPLPPGPLMIDIAGETATAGELARVTHPLVGGIIIFTRNYRDKTQLQTLIRSLRAARPGPLLIAVDQEGGRVQRLQPGFTRLPALGRIGALYADSEEKALVAAEAAGLVMAAEVRAVDIDLSFAPVLDLDFGLSEIIGNRAFHSDPTVVAKLARAYIGGMGQAGMPAVGKHFPGHGGIEEDTHLETVTDHRSLDTMRSLDLEPFRVLMDVLPGLMPAHVRYPAVDPKPASASGIWLEQVGRQALGFTGAYFSDDLGMAGAFGIGTPLERVQAVLGAGCDMALLCNNPAAVEAVLEVMPSRQSTPELRAFIKLATARKAVDQSHYQHALITLQTLLD